MIPFIRSVSELMAITESRDNKKNLSNNKKIHSSTVDSGQRKRYIRSLEEERKVDLPNLPKAMRNRWMHNKVSISGFIDEIDHNIQITSSYDLTLLERQNNRDLKDTA